MFWPNMSHDIHNCVAKCTVCNSCKPHQQKEPLQMHDVPDRPWSIVASYLLPWNGSNYLVTVNSHSGFYEIDMLTSTSSIAVMKQLKNHFSRYGIRRCCQVTDTKGLWQSWSCSLSSWRNQILFCSELEQYIYRRNRRHILKVPEPPPQQEQPGLDDVNTNEPNMEVTPNMPSANPTSSVRRRSRVRKHNEQGNQRWQTSPAAPPGVVGIIFPYILTPIPNLYDHSFPRYGQITFLTFRRPTTYDLDLWPNICQSRCTHT